MEYKDESWEEMLLKVSKKFKVLADFDFLLFLIGIQERGTGYIKYSKEEKMDLINLGRCVLFRHKGFYASNGTDEEGWPTFTVLKQLEELAPSERERILKQAMIEYFDDKL
ncbi:hypothetical protein SAMN06265379_1092 [Saccharicrinis carchari]|uniref:Uncharacterized protein n=1 Tax=Saccharicrinis carchari TaxID=1168039 RepID=A0A521EFK5_SACCC|nr:hypothetical protein [Saccharicrinis carchari]SMO82703.1 hypothetical protein SAMN06265379_1092 [Saccharicrinis carchari]